MRNGKYKSEEDEQRTPCPLSSTYNAIGDFHGKLLSSASSVLGAAVTATKGFCAIYLLKGEKGKPLVGYRSL